MSSKDVLRLVTECADIARDVDARDEAAAVAVLAKLGEYLGGALGIARVRVSVDVLRMNALAKDSEALGRLIDVLDAVREANR